jgi:hypothetical protein
MDQSRRQMTTLDARDIQTRRTAARLTAAQRAALRLLATPGAVAVIGPTLRWPVRVGPDEIGSIGSETLSVLRAAGLVVWIASIFGGTQHITDDGSALVAAWDARSAARARRARRG